MRSLAIKNVESKSQVVEETHCPILDEEPEEKLIEALVEDSIQCLENQEPSWPLDYAWLFDDNYPGGLFSLVGEKAEFYRRKARTRLKI